MHSSKQHHNTNSLITPVEGLVDIRSQHHFSFHSRRRELDGPKQRKTRKKSKGSNKEREKKERSRPAISGVNDSCKSKGTEVVFGEISRLTKQERNETAKKRNHNKTLIIIDNPHQCCM